MIRNDSKSLEYYRNAYEAERFMLTHNYGNKADKCLVRDFEVYIDSNCAIKANSVDIELDSALDVANQISTHANN